MALEPVRQNRRMETALAFYRVNVFAKHPGGCYTCRYFGERVDVAVWCAQPGGEHHRSQAHLGCAFWEREPGADDDQRYASVSAAVQLVQGASKMHVEWQGDHRLLGDDIKQDFEREMTRLGLDPSKFLVEVQREPDLPGADGLRAIRYVIYITDLEHPDRDTWTLHGGHGENWITQLAQVRRR
ncbi:MAG TPA: hypothetical protein VGJ91_17590 [Polyangiaceae bacterium]